MNIAACLLLFSVVATYVEPPPTIQKSSVVVVQRGTTVKLEITGNNLLRTQRLVFDDRSGLVAEINRRAKDRIHVVLTVDAKAKTGKRELRIITPSGASNPVTIRIGLLPVTIEKEPNNRRGQANKLRAPSIVCGSIHARAERDHFVLDAKKGQRVVFDLHAQRIDSALDASLTIVDASGRAVAWGRRAPHGDVALVFDPPTSGAFVLIVRDLRYRGGRGYDYHLHCGDLRRVDTVFPLAGKHGEKTVLTAGDCDPRSPKHETFEVDLAGHDLGQETLELSTPRGTIVSAAFTVTRNDAILESEPNDSRAKCNVIHVPIAVSGRIDPAHDSDYYRLEIKKAATLRISARSSAFGSPLDPLVVLQDKAGKTIKIDDDSGDGNDARIDFNFKPGTYHVIVRSLVRHGGPDHTYLLSIAAPAKARPDFEVRFRPDTPLVRRGSHAKMWCEVVRRAGFTGDVDLSFVDLPKGVTASPVKLAKTNGWSSVFTIRASADAKMGSVPLRLQATASIAGKKLTRDTIPEAGSTDRELAWLTVADKAKFVVSPLGPPPKEVREKWNAERRALKLRFLQPIPAAEAELSRFEDAHREELHWVAVRPEQLRSAKGATLKILRDGSVLSAGKSPDKDTQSFVFETDLDQIAAIRLDILPHKSMPTGGLGRAAKDGNFVLSRFTVTTVDGSKPVKLVRPKARFSQKNYPIAKALDGNAGTGWATAPKSKTANWAIFELEKPLPGRTRLTVTLDQQFGRKFTIGRFRLSVATKRRDARTPVVPRTIHEILMAARADRPEEDVVTLDAWFRKIAPAYNKIRARIAEIDAGRGHKTEIDRLSRQLRMVTPEIAAAQKRWEHDTARKLVKWTALEFKTLRSEKGVRFTREPGNVIRVRRAVADKDNYELIAETGVRGISAIRLETLPTKELEKGGAGLASTGNFVLTGFKVRTWAADKPSAVADVALRTPMASFEQRNLRLGGTLDGKPATGWAVFPQVAKPHYALWNITRPVNHKAGTFLRLYLEHQSNSKRHQLGRFRISVTNAKKPALLERGLPLQVSIALTTPEARRTAVQKRSLRDWYRDIAKELDPLREKIQLLQAQQTAYPPSLKVGKSGRLAVRVNRRDGFDGDVKVTLEGFASGREKNRIPRTFTRSFEAKPVTLPRGKSIAVIGFKARSNCEIGTRFVVVRMEGKVGGETVVEYSKPIPFTVAK